MLNSSNINKMFFHIRNKLKLLNLRVLSNTNNSILVSVHRSCSTGISEHKKLEDYFFDKKVQSILKKITGLSYDKVFQPQKQQIVNDKFEFVTDKQLKQLCDEANAKADAKLQMPPVMSIRAPINEVLAKDPELQYYIQTRLLFIDTSPNRTSRNRIITVRELDGTLRKADWEDRFRMNQIFFPMSGRSLETPAFFEDPNLERLLGQEEFEFVLDAACAQFDPDDPEYHRVTNKTYECIKSKKKFDVLRSTRHFGPMAFYFAFMKDINPLLVDMIEKQLIDDAADTIKLLYILNPDLETSEGKKDMDSVEYVQNYIQGNKSSGTAHLELAFQSFLEIHSKSQQECVSA